MLLSLLHLCDSLFPTGAFAYSDGLEFAADRGLIRGAAELREWLDVCLDEGFGRLDGPGVLIAWSAFGASDWESLLAVDAEMIALRSSSTVRRASRSMGARLLKTWGALHPDGRLERTLALAREHALGPSLPVAFGVACASAGIGRHDGLAGFAYTRLAATVSSAMRVMALGQTEAHQLLARALERVPTLIDEMVARNASPESWAPALDVAQMSQQYVHSRLFRS